MKTMTAAVLRIVLSLGLLLTFALAIGGFYLANMELSKYARDISQLNGQASAGDADVQTLAKLKTELALKADTVKRARAVVAESKQYVYQDQIVKDITAIGASSNVSIEGFDFKAGQSPTGTTGTAPVTTPTLTVPAVPAASTVKSVFASITVDDSVKYSDIMKFIKLIEKNPTKMQIAKVGLVKDEAAPNNVKADAFTIEVYVR